MPATTYTVLVTVRHDGPLPTPARIAEITQCALEEGTSLSGSFIAAVVDAFEGDAIAWNVAKPNRDAAKRFHASERALPDGV